jgi:tetratricopeptide (TPR) repeat protein
VTHHARPRACPATRRRAAHHPATDHPCHRRPARRLPGPPGTLLAALAALLLLAHLAPATGTADAPPPPLTWRDDPVPAAATAGGQGPALLYFTADWCAPCKLLAREVFTHPAGRAELARYRRFRLDLEHPHGRALADTFRVATVPTFVLLDRRGQEIERIRGYRSRRLLLEDLARFRQGEGTLGSLRRALRTRPDDPVLQAELGLRHLERLDLDPAARLLASGLASTGAAALPETLAAEAGRALADVRRRQGDAAAAAVALEDLLARWPEHPYRRVTWQQLADFHRTLGDSTAAVDALREAAAVPPPRVDALVDFARAAARTGRHLPAAEQAARQAVELTDRDDPAAMAALAEVLRHRRAYPEAMVWIKRAVAVAPREERGEWGRVRDRIWQAALAGH